MRRTIMDILTGSLDLIFPPISNYMAEKFYNDRDIKEYLKSSKFYIMAIRKELKFVDYDIPDMKKPKLRFRISIGDFKSSYITLDFNKYVKAVEIYKDAILDLDRLNY